jgi:hypothetical protein
MRVTTGVTVTDGPGADPLRGASMVIVQGGRA